MPELIVNATSTLPPVTGIGRYTRELFGALERRGTHPRYFVGYRWTDELQQPHGVVAAGARGIVSRGGALTWKLARTAQQMAFSLGAGAGKAIYHDPNFVPFRYPGPVITTVHDLSPLIHPDTHPERRVEFMRRNLPRVMNNAAAIVTVSATMRAELEERYPAARDRMFTVPNGMSGNLLAARGDDDFLGDVGLESGAFTLFVGTIEPRKNLDFLLEAYERLPESLALGKPLVVVGGSGWKSEATLVRLHAMQARGMVVLPGFVDDDRLASLYRHAGVFVYPSIYEGFGLPLLEALAFGTPVMASDIPVHREVGGDDVDYFALDDFDGFFERLQASLESPARRVNSRRHLEFSWDAAAREMESIYAGV